MDWKKWRKDFDDNFNAEIAKSNALPKGLQIGKIFRINVADGYAFYEVMKINKKTVRIKCRKDLSPDEYMDRILGFGGSFATNIIEPLIRSEEALAKLFG